MGSMTVGVLGVFELQRVCTVLGSKVCVEASVLQAYHRVPYRF